MCTLDMHYALTAAVFAAPQTMQAKQYASNGVHINNEAHNAYSVVTIAEVFPYAKACAYAFEYREYSDRACDINLPIAQ